MRLTVASFIRTIRSVGRAVAYLDTHLDEDLDLRRLADVACLSPSHFDRLYRRKINETPMATVRRLRLARARRQIESGGQAITRVAHDAGYGSLAAFSRAFAAAFGHAPSQPAPSRPGATLPAPRLVRLAALPMAGLPYRGSLRQACRVGAELDGRIAVSGTRHWRKWRLCDAREPLSREEGHADCVIAVPQIQLTAPLPDADPLILGAHTYAVFDLLGDAHPGLPALHAHIRDHLAAEPVEGRALWRDVSVPGYTPPSEHHQQLWLPVVARIDSAPAIAPGAFTLPQVRRPCT
ncbi:MAG: AraC family transcriptional regulator [Rhodocyclaceae bacterium]